VSAITIPSLITRYKNEVQVTALKKFYSEFSQALQKTKADTGCSDSECMGFAGSTNATWLEWANKWASTYFNVVKFCYGTNDCDFNIKYINGQSAGSGFPSGNFSFITADGFIIKIVPSSGTGWKSVSVDVNGKKGPNQIGRDFHLFRISSKGILVPYYGYQYACDSGTCNNNLYWKTNTNLCNPTKTNAGASYGCTARIIESGWKIDY
jgi:hypothetical protein